MTKIPLWWGVLGMTILEQGGLDICPWDTGQDIVQEQVQVQDELVNEIKIYGEKLEKANIIE